MGKLKSPLPKKYKYRKEQILNIAALSGEIPTDLYKYLNISQANFKKICSNYMRENILRSIKKDNIHGYVLQAEGKQYLRNQSRIQLSFDDIQTQTINAQQRRRNHQMARIYAVLDSLNIPYEPSYKPKRESFDYTGEQIVFYSAQEYKQEKQERGVGFQGSRFKGLLVGENKVLPVYLADKHLINFHRTEMNLINQISKDYFHGDNPENAIIFCSSAESVANLFSEINNIDNRKGTIDITSSSYYDDIYIVPLDDNLPLAILSIFKENEIKYRIKTRYGIVPTETYSIYDGQKENCEVLIALNSEVIRISRYLNGKAYKGETAFVFCHEYMKPAIDRYIQECNQKGIGDYIMTVKIQTIKAEDVIDEFGELIIC